MESKRLVRAFIVDDDLNAATLLKRMLADYSVEIVGEAQDANDDTLNEINEQNPDLLFLDVELPSMLGLDFYMQIRPQVSSDMKVVFYTGHDRYMLEALRRQAFDYLLKPPSRDELAKVITHFYESKLSTIRAAVPAAGIQPSIVIADDNGNHLVFRPADIAFFRFAGDRRVWEAMTTQGQCYQLRYRTTADIILAFSKNFVQVHKSYIVNLQYVSRITESQVLLLPPLNTIDEVRVSKGYRSSLLSAFYNM